MTPTFTSDWFSPKTYAWEAHVVPAMDGIVGRRWLEVGSYEGRSALWIVDHVLDSNGKLVCIDFFNDAEAYISLWGSPGYGGRFFENTKDKENIKPLVGRSEKWLPFLNDVGATFHGCYLDADHKESAVAYDLEKIWPMLLENGILVCDDYGFEGAPGTKIAIDKFLSRPDIHSEVLFVDFQIIIKKKAA